MGGDGMGVSKLEDDNLEMAILKYERSHKCIR